MPRFKSTQNILIDNSEEFSKSWTGNSFPELPPMQPWDNSRPLSPEDVDLWEVITEMSGPTGIYAAWLPYAEFYMIVKDGSIDSTYYGVGADIHASKRCEKLRIPHPKK